MSIKIGHTWPPRAILQFDDGRHEFLPAITAPSCDGWIYVVPDTLEVFDLDWLGRPDFRQTVDCRPRVNRQDLEACIARLPPTTLKWGARAALVKRAVCVIRGWLSGFHTNLFLQYTTPDGFHWTPRRGEAMRLTDTQTQEYLRVVTHGKSLRHIGPDAGLLRCSNPRQHLAWICDTNWSVGDVGPGQPEGPPCRRIELD